jgi:DNA-binding response OmpR family regulator
VVDLARSAGEAGTLAFVHDYDGILLDVSLPDGSGLQIARELRQEGAADPRADAHLARRAPRTWCGG